jgi:hypothetical protein
MAESDKDIVVITHGGCWDGFCAAWLFHRVFPDATYVPGYYGQKPPDVTGKRVFIADFSYPADTMIEMSHVAKSLVVLDHHKTAEPELAKLRASYQCPGDHPEGFGVMAVFDGNKSGGRLTWDYLRPRLGFPAAPTWLVDYTEDRDLWLWKLPHSKAINACLRSYPLDFALWDTFSMIEPMSPKCSFVECGEAILRREEQIIDQACGHAVPLALCGLKGLQVNSTILFSEIAGRLSEKDGIDFGACWFVRSDGKKQWSLRSRSDVDVSAVAKEFGGGGHKNAAGFESDSIDAKYPVLHDQILWN